MFKERQSLVVKILWMAGCVALPLIVGWTSAMVAGDIAGKYGALRWPPLAPAGWVFPVVWTVLYVLMGVASYFILQHWRKSRGAEKDETMVTLVIYGVQLAFNFMWSIVFFSWRWYWPALIWLLIMWVMIIALMQRTGRFSRAGMWMLAPYVVWTTFAAYLNLGVAVLN